MGSLLSVGEAMMGTYNTPAGNQAVRTKPKKKVTDKADKTKPAKPAKGKGK